MHLRHGKAAERCFRERGAEVQSSRDRSQHSGDYPFSFDYYYLIILSRSELIWQLLDIERWIVLVSAVPVSSHDAADFALTMFCEFFAPMIGKPG